MARAGFGGPRKTRGQGHIQGPDGRWYKEGAAFGGGDGEVHLARCYNERGGKGHMRWVHNTNPNINWRKVKDDVVYGLNVKNGQIVQEEGDDNE